MLSSLPYNKIQFFDDNGDPLDGGWLYTCLPAGSITDLKATWQNAAGSILNSNPIHLDSAGRATVFLDGFYHIFLEKSDHTAVWDVDNISAMPFVASVSVEWVVSVLVPTYVSGTSFTVPGNQTATFPQGLRIKATVTAATIYGTVTSSSAGGSPVVTTVNVIWDSGSLNAGLSVIATGILTPVYTSGPVIPVSAKNSTQVLTVLDMFRIIVGSNTISMNFTLPTTVPSGTWVRIKNAGTNNIVLIGTINGLASPTLVAGGDALLFNDGSSWYAIFFDAANGSFTTSLKVGSQGGFPAFQVDNAGDVTITGGTDTIWNLIHGATTALQIDASHNVLIKTRGYVAVNPLDTLEIATKGYVDTQVGAVGSAASAAVALGQAQRLFPQETNNYWRMSGLTGTSLNWTTMGTTVGDGASNTGGYFQNIWIASTCNLYFHLFDILSALHLPSSTVWHWGIRIGIASPPLTGTSIVGPSILPYVIPYPWPVPQVPSVFTTAYTEDLSGLVGTGDNSYERTTNYIVLGPLTSVTQGWYSVFIQIYGYEPSGGGSMDIIIDGGVFVTLSVT